jgi:hypothetical protein
MDRNYPMDDSFLARRHRQKYKDAEEKNKSTIPSSETSSMLLIVLSSWNGSVGLGQSCQGSTRTVLKLHNLLDKRKIGEGCRF